MTADLRERDATGLADDIYTASDGSRWDIMYGAPPVPDRHFDWCATHSEYGGPGDDRHVYGATREACIEAVEEFVSDSSSARSGASPRFGLKIFLR